jgi:hypothetical protein
LNPIGPWLGARLARGVAVQGGAGAIATADSHSGGVGLIAGRLLERAKGAWAVVKPYVDLVSEELVMATWSKKPGPRTINRLAALRGPLRTVAQPAATVVRLTAKGCSKTLGANLVKAGYQKLPGVAAHHIVAGGAKKAEDARRVLAKFGIDINDAVNGVFLPHEPSSQAPGAYHRTLHTDQYYMKVNRLLSKAQSRADAIRILQRIQKDLLANRF